MKPALALGRRLAAAGILVLPCLFGTAAAQRAAEPERPLERPSAAASPQERVLLDAREALRRGERARVLAARQQLVAARHPMAGWADYWELSPRLAQATGDEVQAFLERWSGSYVEDRLRNDWLLETGRRRDWAAFQRELPRFKMNDDAQVRCYALLVEALEGREVRRTGLQAWFDQREADDGCHQLATHLRDTQQIGQAELWRKLRISTEAARQRPARQAAQLLGAPTSQALDQLWDQPERFLNRLPQADRNPQSVPLSALALIRLASQDPESAARQLDAVWGQRLRGEWASAAWGAVARAATLRQLAQAGQWAEKALALDAQAMPTTPTTPRDTAIDGALTDDTLAWAVRALLRDTPQRPQAWAGVVQAIDRMDSDSRANPTWVYWRARALLARSRPGGAAGAGDALRDEALAHLRGMASPLHFYGQLALEALGQRPPPLPQAEPISAAERDAALASPGLQRALRLIELGLRSEGVREWNFSLIGRSDRELLAAAQLACERQIIDRCISAAERARTEIDPTLRYPLAFRDDIIRAAVASGLEPSLVLGLIRQESRFVTYARSHVGASGLMQVMPPTARWTAQRIGLSLPPDWRDDRATNLRLGTAYLRMVLDDMEGSMPMALAGYNAGPSRPRRWRESNTLEPAIWIETIPIHETRDYVKKVLSNTTVYAQRLGSPSATLLKPWLGADIGPRDPAGPVPNKELP
jgi:soluble lytic murein transglycosylase